MPETMSVERRVLLRMLGADIVLTPGPKGMTGAIAKASELLDQHGDGAFMPQQFNNPANPEIHRRTTAEEIWNATEGKIDVLISGIGTGGTITGVSEVIKSRKQLTSIAVEPKDSPILSGGKPGPHKIQGIGAGFVPNVLNIDIIDDIVQVGNDDAFETARNVSITDGIPAGISTGAAISAGIEVAKRSGMEDKMIVIIGASPTERYLSTALAEKARTESAAMTAVEI
jgi:cysteine synthase A